MRRLVLVFGFSAFLRRGMWGGIDFERIIRVNDDEGRS